MHPTTRSGQVFTRIVVPLIAFVVVVGGVAWVIQYLPYFRGQKDPDAANVQNLVKFRFDTAAWPEDKDRAGQPVAKIENYLAEFEPGEEGHFDFPLENTSGKEIEVGLERLSCTCQDVKIALLPAGTSESDASKLNWVVLLRATKPGEKQGDEKVFIPVEGRAIVRLGWKAKKEQEMVAVNRLKAALWFQPQGSKNKQTQELHVAISVVPPVLCLPDSMLVPSFKDTHKDHFVCWSATHDLNAIGADKVPPIDIDKSKVDAGFQFKLTPLRKAELEEFQKDLAKRVPPIVSRAKSAVKIDVEVQEKKDDANVQRGEFKTNVPLLIHGIPQLGPIVSGSRDSTIKLDGHEFGTINYTVRLGSIEPEGKDKKYNLRTPPDTVLTLVSYPPNIKVEVKLEDDAGVNVWRLKVIVPPNPGHFPSPPNHYTIVISSQPAKSYLPQLVSQMGIAAGTNQLAPFVNIASSSILAASTGENAQLTGFAVFGEVVRSSSR